MTKHLSTSIRIMVCLCVWTAIEFAMPLHVYAASRQKDGAVFQAVRQPVIARLATTPLPKPVVRQTPVKPQYRTVKQVHMMVTAYSSTPDQCDGNPFITANGSQVKLGTFAVNGYPFGTKFRIPSHFGDQIFIVQDRMSKRYGKNRGDIWMQSRKEALQWGARRVQLEIVEEVNS